MPNIEAMYRVDHYKAEAMLHKKYCWCNLCSHWSPSCVFRDAGGSTGPCLPGSCWLALVVCLEGTAHLVHPCPTVVFIASIHKPSLPPHTHFHSEPCNTGVQAGYSVNPTLPRKIGDYPIIAVIKKARWTRSGLTWFDCIQPATALITSHSFCWLRALITTDKY